MNPTLKNIIFSKSTLLQDYFNREDNAETMGNAETGQAWVAINGTWGISSNKAYCVGEQAGGTTLIKLNKPNYKMNITVNSGRTDGSNYSFSDVILGYLNGGNFLYVRTSPGLNTITLRQYDGGVASILQTGSVTISSGADYGLTVTVKNGKIKVLINGKPVIDCEVANKYLTGFIGMQLVNSGTPPSNARWSNLRVVSV